MADLESAYNQGPRTWNDAFPPICIPNTRWDPTALAANHVLPPLTSVIPQALDPRPASMICKQYYTFDTAMPAQVQPVQTITLAGGAAGKGFPYVSYNPANESDLFRLQEHLTKCAEKRYVVRGTPAADVLPGYESTNHAESSIQYSNQCRVEDDAAANNRSSRLFFNPTRYDRMPLHK